MTGYKNELRKIANSLNSDYESNYSLIYGRIQPQDTFTECFILSKILSNNAIGTVALILKPDDFYLESHNIIFSACINVFVEGQNVDLLSCRNELIKLEKLEQVGGIHYLTKIVQDHYTFHDVEAMACLIRDISIKRKVIQLCTEKINLAFNN
jgi:replicative DNA helicase